MSQIILIIDHIIVPYVFNCGSTHETQVYELTTVSVLKMSLKKIIQHIQSNSREFCIRQTHYFQVVTDSQKRMIPIVACHYS